MNYGYQPFSVAFVVPGLLAGMITVLPESCQCFGSLQAYPPCSTHTITKPTGLTFQLIFFKPTGLSNVICVAFKLTMSASLNCPPYIGFDCHTSVIPENAVPAVHARTERILLSNRLPSTLPSSASHS